ncbi:MAG TPA: cell wall metabolism sensor histidine kinase WalK [Candidatus Monoglobus merdigallinarum]|uniref:histidine kinase n=1 Tax=Candidatus Monoglobus merdigallinarum TaxID=2838698 RepID=A0A9D1PQT9_9FIRM|nr:cell wall metabolism sensor histidine kinase WalK [Candidatus Monoglobus merdigallinarum]
MFKSKLKYKIIAIFMVMAALLVGAFGTLSLYFTASSYSSRFYAAADSVTEGGFAQEVQSIMNTSKRDFVKQYEIEQLIRSRTADLGLGDGRRCYILLASTGEIVSPTYRRDDNIGTTRNLSTAMQRHTKGNERQLGDDVLDYAYYVRPLSENAADYVIYISDNKAELREITGTVGWVFFWVMAAGLAIAALTGIYVSRYVTAPLRKLSRRADSFARGVYDLPSELNRTDEIGALSKAFNHMGSVMSRTISQIGAEKHKVDVILEHITNGIMAFDAEGQLIHINPAASELLELDGEDPDDFDLFFEQIGAGVCMAEFLYLDKYASKIRDITYKGKHIRIYFVPFKMDNEKTAGVVCVFEDFTEQFNLEIARREFVAEVSHELKTPLFIIKTHTETLLNGYMDDKAMAKKFLTTIEAECDKMTDLVRNLLDLSKFDVKKFEMKPQVFSIDKMLRGIVSRFALEAERENIELVYLPMGELPQMYADPTQIERAIVNIVSNAIKYGGKGSHVSIASGSMYNEVYIKVEDDGAGIPKADLEHVFDRFFRVDRARTREKGGTGLGLSIAKEIIESHGGTIVIESEYGKFTRVTISLPTANVGVGE